MTPSLPVTQPTDDAKKAAEEYGDKMKVLQGRFICTADRLAMAFEAGAAWQRERDAKLCEKESNAVSPLTSHYAQFCANAIRSQGSSAINPPEPGGGEPSANSQKEPLSGTSGDYAAAEKRFEQLMGDADDKPFHTPQEARPLYIKAFLDGIFHERNPVASQGAKVGWHSPVAEETSSDLPPGRSLEERARELQKACWEIYAAGEWARSIMEASESEIECIVTALREAQAKAYEDAIGVAQRELSYRDYLTENAPHHRTHNSIVACKEIIAALTVRIRALRGEK